MMLCIFGNPVSHSKSPLMHNSVIKHLGIKGCYARYKLEDGKKIKERFFQLNLLGANVTVPHKESAFALCDEVRGVAQKIQAVNTLVREGDKMIGYNTDAEGFLKAIEEFDYRNILIIGAGGTAKALCTILHMHNKKFALINRSEGRLDFFKAQGFQTFTWESFENDSYDLVINTTSAGLEDDALPLPEAMMREVLQKARFGVDAIYGKQTPFLKLAQSLSLQTKDGSDLLLYQGLLAFNYFTQGRYSLKAIEKYMRASFRL